MKQLLFAMTIILCGTLVGAQEKPDALKAYQDKQYEEAIRICLEEIKATPSNRDSYVVLCWSLEKAGRYAEAFDHAKLGLERTGADARLLKTAEESLTKLSNALYSQGRLDEAAATIKQLIVFLPNSPNLPQAYGLLGEWHLKKGNFIHADTALSYALHANPNAVAWWVNAGLAREKSGDLKSALAAFERALRLDPGQAEAERGRARITERLSAAPTSSP